MRLFYKILFACIVFLALFTVCLADITGDYADDNIIVKFIDGIVNLSFGDNVCTIDTTYINDYSVYSLLNAVGADSMERIFRRSVPGYTTTFSDLIDDSVSIVDLSQCYVIYLDGSITPVQAVSIMKNNKNVIYAHLNGIVISGLLPHDDDYYNGKAWHINVRNLARDYPDTVCYFNDNDTDAMQVWKSYSSEDDIMDDVIIAIVDDFVTIDHPDYDDLIPDDTTLYDYYSIEDRLCENPHGTVVAGAAVAENDNNSGVSVIAWGAKMMPFSYARNGSTSISDAAADIEEAYLNNADIINISWSVGWTGNNDNILREVIDNAYSYGSIIVVIAQNEEEGGRTAPFDHIPGAYEDEVLTIGASTSTGDTTSFTNFGTLERWDTCVKIDLIAPGQGIPTTDATNYHHGNSFHTGTSISAPIVSGIAALVKHKWPGIRNYEAYKIIRETAVWNDSWAAGDTLYYGQGIANAYHAVNGPVMRDHENATLRAIDTGLANHVVELDWGEWYHNVKSPDEDTMFVYAKYYENGHLDHSRTRVFGLPPYTLSFVDTFYQVLSNDYNNNNNCGNAVIYQINMKDHSGLTSGIDLYKFGDHSMPIIIPDLIDDRMEIDGGRARALNDVTITPNGKLILSGNTSLDIAYNSTISVYGELDIRGAGSCPIIIDEMSSDSSWKGFVFENGSKVYMENVDISNATTPITVKGYDTEFNMNNFIINEADGRGVCLNDASNIHIRLGEIKNTGMEGILIYKGSGIILDSLDVDSCSIGIKVVQSNITLTNSKIYNNDNYGILITNSNGGVISQCEIRGNQKTGISLEASDPIIKKTVIEGNSQNGIHMISSSDPVLGVYGDLTYGNTLYQNGSSGYSGSELYCASSRPVFGNRHNDFVDTNAEYLLYDASYKSPPYDGSGNYWEGYRATPQYKWYYPSSCVATTNQDTIANHPEELDENDISFSLALEYESSGMIEDASQIYGLIIRSNIIDAAFDGWIRCRMQLGDDPIAIMEDIETYENIEGYENVAYWAKIRMNNYMKLYETTITMLDTFIITSETMIDSIQGIIAQMNTYIEMQLSEDDENILTRIEGQKGYVDNRAVQKLGIFEYPVVNSYEDYLEKHEELIAIMHGMKSMENKEVELPREYKMNPAYPNPFNPTIVIPFEVPENAYVEITVYNILGQKVRTLCKENRIAGKHMVIWDGASEGNRSLASGVYIVKMNANNYEKVQRVVMMK